MHELFTLEDVKQALAKAPDAIAIPFKFLGALSVSDVSSGTRILVETNEPLEDPFIGWNGELYREGNSLMAYVPYNVNYHHWDHVISHKLYFDLLVHAVERRSKKRGDVNVVSHNMESSALYFSFQCALKAANLSTAYTEARNIQKNLEHLAEEVNRRVKEIVTSILEMVESIVDAEQGSD